MTSNREIHYRYAITALLIAVCGAVGFGLVDDSKLVERVSFALTVNSLVLGVVAIIYSFMASHKQEHQLAKLVETNTQISTAAEMITTISSEIGKQLREVPKRFDDVDKGLKEIKNATLQTSNEADNIDLASTAPVETVPVSSRTVNFTEYLTELTYAGIASIYMFFKALESGNTIRKIDTERDNIPEMYFQIGNLQATEASGYLAAKYTSNEITPIRMNEAAKKAIGPFINKSREIFDKNHDLIKMIDAIDQALS